jgi:hypothetical protein
MGTNSALCKNVDAESAQVGISEIPTCPKPPALAFAPASVAVRTIIGAVRRVSFRARVMTAWAAQLLYNNNGSREFWGTGINVKKFAFGMLAAVALTGSAFAADMAPRYTKAPPPPPVVVYNWTGCYIGGNVGGGTRLSRAALTRRQVRCSCRRSI